MKTMRTTVIDGDAPLCVAASMLPTVTPLRRRGLAWVDRRFYEGRFDTERLVQHLAGRVRDETASDSTVDKVLDTISEIRQPNSVGVWLKEKDLVRTVSRSTSDST